MCVCKMYSYSLPPTAAALENTVSRLVYVGTFAVSILSIADRWRAPFPPLLGETFEYVDELGGLSFISEQVSLHPSVAASHAETDDFVFWHSCSLKSKIVCGDGGNYGVEVSVEGRNHVLLKQTGHEFDWKTPKMIFTRGSHGQMDLQYAGSFDVVNRKTKEKIEFKFVSSPLERRGVCGSVVSSEKGSFKGVKVSLFGEWDRQLCCNHDVVNVMLEEKISKRSSRKYALSPSLPLFLPLFLSPSLFLFLLLSLTLPFTKIPPCGRERRHHNPLAEPIPHSLSRTPRSTGSLRQHHTPL